MRRHLNVHRRHLKAGKSAEPYCILAEILTVAELSLIDEECL